MKAAQQALIQLKPDIVIRNGHSSPAGSLERLQPVSSQGSLFENLSLRQVSPSLFGTGGC